MCFLIRCIAPSEASVDERLAQFGGRNRWCSGSRFRGSCPRLARRSSSCEGPPPYHVALEPGRRQVWNRQRRRGVLRDVHDVAAGYVTRMVWNDPDAWIISDAPSHEAIIGEDVFVAATAQRLSGKKRGAVVKPRRRNVYLLTSLIRCGLCGRRMIGSWNHGAAYYRCGYPAEYAGAVGKPSEVPVPTGASSHELPRSGAG